MIALTEKLLSSAGGWQAMKAARELVQAGRVGEATYEPPILRGEVREGAKKYRAGLRIQSATDLENLCTCRESRQWGKVCAHSLAVGLAVLAPPSTTKLEGGAPATPGDDVSSASATRVRRSSPLQVSACDTGATPAPLHVILPPNFPAAWDKGQIMICIEAELEGRRVMLDALPKVSVDDRDFSLAEQLPHGMNMVSAAEFLQLLPILRGHPRITFGRGKSVRVAAEIRRPRMIVKQHGAEDFVIAPAKLPNESFLVAGDCAWSLREQEFAEIGAGLPASLTTALREPLRRGPEFFALELPLWREVADVILPDGMRLPLVATAEPEFTLTLAGSLQRLRATLTCRYGDRPPFAPTAEPEKNFAVRDRKNPDQLLLRNLLAESRAVARLEAAGFVDGELRDPARAARFFAFDYPALANAWQVTVAPSLGKAQASLEPVAPTIEIVSSGEDWFELRYSVASAEGEHIPLAEVQRLLRSGQSRLQLKNGKQAVFDPDALEDFEQLLRDADPRQHQPGVYRFDSAQAGYLTATASEIGARLVDAAHVLRSQGFAPNLGPLGDKLRDYQRTGVAWLAALAGQKLGGILADEMGLGKTVQTLAFLQLRQGNGPALIVCPTSLLANWQREAARFTPELRVLVLDGANRAAKVAQLASYDLGLTSYGLLRRDAELYRAVPFDTVVLDEAQHIKNPDTQNAQAAFNLPSRQRFVLTGTPMENSVRDLWSLMNFVVPGYLGTRADFRERYENPLTAGPEPALQRRLARRLRPFLLRRKKADVAKELPAKIEQVVPCDLGRAQRATYDALLREIQSGLGSSPNDGAKRMKMLTGLLRLRQACCDLRLLGLEKPESAKLDLLDELLEEIIDGGHRVLIFSQFVTMLDLVRQRLDAKSTPHCYLAGLTKDRQTQVDRFQNDPAIPVFLISLKAGGVGLNLSAADTVIHFDPWWNAAVEAQATDRAHRIGQTRVVTAYKLIARDTVEEKILKLQNRKRELANAMLESDDAPLMNGLTAADLAELLET
ncbi:MAG: SNF2-related protein [Chthoniobacterales bacterium]